MTVKGCEPNCRLVVLSTPIAPPVPVPVSVIACGELAASLKILRLAVLAPERDGAKATDMLQVADAARVGAQVDEVVKSSGFNPATDMLIPDSMAVPVFFIVNTCWVLVVPTA